MSEVLLPAAGRGQSVLLVHAWWGLNQTIRDYGTALTREGFVVGLPDLFEGESTASIEGAQILVRKHGMAAEERLAAALDEFFSHQAVEQAQIGTVGFSFGGSCLLDAVSRGDRRIGRAVVYYATYPMAEQHPPILAHLAESDDFESAEEMAAMSAAMATRSAMPARGTGSLKRTGRSTTRRRPRPPSAGALRSYGTRPRGSSPACHRAHRR
jgi:carboxymethylenebutenolidase